LRVQFPELTAPQRVGGTLSGTEEISSPTAEFDLFVAALASHAGEVLSRDTIMMHMRGLEYGGFDRSIDNAHFPPAQAPGATTPKNPHRIKTVRAKGYLFSPTGWN